MNKNESMDILKECKKWLENASDKQIEKMRDIYKEEKENSYFENDIEIILPSQMKDCENNVEEETIDFPNRKIKNLTGSNNMMRYCDNEFNEANINEWEDFAA